MTSKKKTPIEVAVIGHGWLAKGLRQFWLQGQQSIEANFFSRTAEGSVIPFELTPLMTSIPKEFIKVTHILYTLPPSRDTGRYLRTLKAFCSLIPSETKFILISTTSVLENNSGICGEDIIPKVNSSRAKDLREAEEVVLEKFEKAVIIRSGGQYGPGRYPAKFLAQREEIKNSLQPINVIHQVDLIRICTLALLNADAPPIIHAVSPFHPSKESFYKNQAKELGLNLPPGDKLTGNERYIESDYLKKVGFVFEKQNHYL